MKRADYISEFYKMLFEPNKIVSNIVTEYQAILALHTVQPPLITETLSRNQISKEVTWFR